MVSRKKNRKGMNGLIFLHDNISLFVAQRKIDSCCDGDNNETKGKTYGQVNVIFEDQFYAHIGQNDDQAMFEIVEGVNHICYKKVHGAQTQDCKYIGRKDDKRLGSDAENSWNTIECKQDIRKFNQDQCQQQGGGNIQPSFPQDKLLA